MEWARLTEETWRANASAHGARVDGFVSSHLARRKDHVKHPVHDFLFVYYNHRPAQLRRWHPGPGVVLEGGAEHYRDLKGYTTEGDDARLDPAYVAAQLGRVRTTRALLAATASRTPNLGCFGLHEWAMVHRLSEDETRHADWPLRLGATGTDEVVESHRIACSHFDAYRFFTPTAVELNTLRPRSEDRVDFEQPACLHANMDLYKVAFRLSPMVPSDLVADCFELARDIRTLDMRAAPYDLSGLTDHDGQTFTPVKIETPEGKREYAEHQRRFAARSAPVRQRLIDECDRLLTVAPRSGNV
ncbi:3-methyladenine DNA glycosylase [Nocardioides alcanivorans]|uniref:3-methyladenine DNA glycosylase n=1 Tax=Nocardioides alcanivorans TaxID=2897352 RepID=UPI001F457503|nr:3-methyladenine DNA glycosylase [Nocardioides alcanivorans]